MLKKVPGVMGVVGSGGQCQVVIGRSVIEVYDEILKPGTLTGGTPAPAAKEKRDVGSTALALMAGIHVIVTALEKKQTLLFKSAAQPRRRGRKAACGRLHRKHTGC